MRRSHQRITFTYGHFYKNSLQTLAKFFADKSRYQNDIMIVMRYVSIHDTDLNFIKKLVKTYTAIDNSQKSYSFEYASKPAKELLEMLS